MSAGKRAIAEGDEAMDVVGSLGSRGFVSLAGVARHGLDARFFDSNFPTEFSGWWSGAVHNCIRYSSLIKGVHTRVSVQPSKTSSVMRSERMSTLSEQDHLNPKDPRYYAPRWLRQKAGSRPVPDPEADTPFSPASFDSEHESNVSHALLQRLDPEVMQEPGYELDSGKALRSITVRFVQLQRQIEPRKAAIRIGREYIRDIAALAAQFSLGNPLFVGEYPHHPDRSQRNRPTLDRKDAVVINRRAFDIHHGVRPSLA